MLYLVCNILVSGFQQRQQKKEIPKNMQNLPGSGPVGQLPELVLSITFSLTAMLAFLNPFQFGQMIRQLAGQVAIIGRLHPLPSLETYIQQIRYTLPLSGQWIVNG